MATSWADLRQQTLEVHQRLLHGDPTASADAAELLLDPVVARLQRKWPGLAHTDACHDAATDVLVVYLADPSRYQPTQSSLVGWLVMQAHGDLLNDHASKPKQFERMWLAESAMPVDPSTGETPQLGDQAPSFDTLPEVNGSTVLAAVRDAFPNERDRQLIWLMCIEGSHSTEEAAKVLGLAGLSPTDRAAEVKRHKDRIMRRLRRLRLDDHDE
jgi:RNA polymerase sigma-70 factor (ECF subfamily)